MSARKINNIFYVIDACRTTHKTLMRKLNTIINLLTNAETQSQVAIVDETHLLPNFPLSTLEDFQKFEADLKIDKEIRKQFVFYTSLVIFIIYIYIPFISNL